MGCYRAQDALRAAGIQREPWPARICDELLLGLRNLYIFRAEEVSTEIRAASDFPNGVFYYAEDEPLQLQADHGKSLQGEVDVLLY